MRCVEEIRAGLADILERDSDSLLLGEDICDPYGGAFKATEGLSTRFPGQVLQTPVSEAGFTGLAAGLAYVGQRPIVEIMFGDFVTLVADAVINGAAKFPWLRGKTSGGSVLIRTPMGGRRGYGPIHSQSLEKLYFGWPEVAVIAPSLALSPRALLQAAFAHPAAVKFFIENKSDYPAEPWTDAALADRGFRREVEPGALPLTLLHTARPAETADLVLCCYGGMAAHALEAAYRLLIEDEATVTLCIPSLISPLDVAPIARCAGGARGLVSVEEGYAAAGWGPYLLGRLAEAGCGLPLDRVRMVGPAFAPIPASPPVEQAHLPGVTDILRAARELL